MKATEKLGSSVAPLNPEIAAYMRAVEVFKSHQCVPALLSAIDRAILAKAGFAEIIESVSTLLSEDDDKFWGAYGSKYLRSLDCDE